MAWSERKSDAGRNATCWKIGKFEGIWGCWSERVHCRVGSQGGGAVTCSLGLGRVTVEVRAGWIVWKDGPYLRSGGW